MMSDNKINILRLDYGLASKVLPPKPLRMGNPPTTLHLYSLTCQYVEHMPIPSPEKAFQHIHLPFIHLEGYAYMYLHICLPIRLFRD